MYKLLLNNDKEMHWKWTSKNKHKKLNISYEYIKHIEI